MTETARQAMQGRIKLDGKTFKDVSFENAVLVYEGGTAPHFVNCTFTEANFAFEGAANNTINFLRSMLPAHTNMRPVVLGLLPEFGGA